MAAQSFAQDSLAYAFLLASDTVAAVMAGRNLDAALASSCRADPALPADRRAAVQDLSFGTLRSYGRGDFFLQRLLRRSLPPQERQLRALLLVALFRLDNRPQDIHTTVDQAVAAAGSLSGGRLKGLVNAVLRNYLRRRETLAEAAAHDEVARYQHPRWWIGAVRAAYPDAWQAILEAGNARPPMILRVNRRRADAASCLATFAAHGIAARALDETAMLLEKPRPVAKLPGFAEGLFSVQDWGAQQAAPLLDAHSGMRVLDACAAPGNKTAHLLELADIEVLALDSDPARVSLIEQNLERLGLGAQVLAADARDPAAWWDGRPFQRILADVPCSASGVVRRHPDIKWLRRQGDITSFAQTQAQILDALWRLLAPDGRMLYCTCSLFPQENGMQIRSFAARHSDALQLPIAQDSGNRESPQWQLTPQAQHDGFFYALLAKRA